MVVVLADGAGIIRLTYGEMNTKQFYLILWLICSALNALSLCVELCDDDARIRGLFYDGIGM